MLRNLFLIFVLMTTGLSYGPAGAAAKPSRITGSWSISWQARIGMERGTIQFQQKGNRLTGVFQGHGIPGTVSGNLDGTNVSFNLEFQGKAPYTIVFTGIVDGDKMTGKFQFQGMKDGYDQHGENVQSIDYSWTATHAVDQQKSISQPQKPAR